MTLSADIEKSRLSVMLDVRHPLAYMALPATIALAESLSLEVNWLPLRAPPLHPPSRPARDDDRGARHRRLRAQAIAREIETYAEARGLVIREYYRSGASDAADLGWLWMRDRHPQQLQRYLTELFRAYWSVELDPADRDGVAGLVASSGGDRSGFLAWSAQEGRAAAAALAEELGSRGLYQVPAYAVDGEVFYGRAHLPMIRWILAGRSGAIPI